MSSHSRMAHEHLGQQLCTPGHVCYVPWSNIIENTWGKRYDGSKAGIYHSFIIITFTLTFRTVATNVSLFVLRCTVTIIACKEHGVSNTTRLHTGILVLVNNSLISWYLECQNTVECSTFGSEFVALRISVEQLEVLRCKLRMFGVPIDGPADVYCDNQSFLTLSRTWQPTSTNRNYVIA